MDKVYIFSFVLQELLLLFLVRKERILKYKSTTQLMMMHHFFSPFPKIIQFFFLLLGENFHENFLENDDDRIKRNDKNPSGQRRLYSLLLLLLDPKRLFHICQIDEFLGHRLRRHH